jgi:DNA mismatch repair protein MutL
VCKYALARPEVSFSLISGKKSYFKTPGNGSLRDAALAVYGLEYVSSLLEVEYEGASLQLKGLISPPERSRNNRRHQLFFINSAHSQQSFVPGY